MSRRGSKEYSIKDYGIHFLSPILALVSGYMYQITRTDRYVFGHLIGDHVSNFFGTALVMYLVTAITTGVEKNTDIESVKKLAIFMQVTCAIALIGINLNLEVWEGNEQMVGDLTAAFIALAVVWINTRNSYNELSR